MKTAEQIYSLFKERGDAEHIATPVNIREIIDFCAKNNPIRILEMGGGGRCTKLCYACKFKCLS